MEHRSLCIAYDLDNTVLDYHKQGHDYSSIIMLLQRAAQCGLYLICFTASEDTEKIKAFLTENKIPFNAINENPPFFKGASRKIYYNLFLDDRAGLGSAMKQLRAVLTVIEDDLHG